MSANELRRKISSVWFSDSPQNPQNASDVVLALEMEDYIIGSLFEDLRRLVQLSDQYYTRATKLKKEGKDREALELYKKFRSGALYKKFLGRR